MNQSIGLKDISSTETIVPSNSIIKMVTLTEKEKESFRKKFASTSVSAISMLSEILATDGLVIDGRTKPEKAAQLADQVLKWVETDRADLYEKFLAVCYILRIHHEGSSLPSLPPFEKIALVGVPRNNKTLNECQNEYGIDIIYHQQTKKMVRYVSVQKDTICIYPCLIPAPLENPALIESRFAKKLPLEGKFPQQDWIIEPEAALQHDWKLNSGHYDWRMNSGKSHFHILGPLRPAFRWLYDSEELKENGGARDLKRQLLAEFQEWNRMVEAAIVNCRVPKEGYGILVTKQVIDWFLKATKLERHVSWAASHHFLGSYTESSRAEFKDLPFFPTAEKFKAFYETIRASWLVNSGFGESFEFSRLRSAHTAIPSEASPLGMPKDADYEAIDAQRLVLPSEKCNNSALVELQCHEAVFGVYARLPHFALRMLHGKNASECARSAYYAFCPEDQYKWSIDLEQQFSRLVRDSKTRNELLTSIYKMKGHIVNTLYSVNTEFQRNYLKRRFLEMTGVGERFMDFLLRESLENIEALDKWDRRLARRLLRPLVSDRSDSGFPRAFHDINPEDLNDTDDSDDESHLNPNAGVALSTISAVPALRVQLVGAVKTASKPNVASSAEPVAATPTTATAPNAFSQMVRPAYLSASNLKPASDEQGFYTAYLKMLKGPSNDLTSYDALLNELPKESSHQPLSTGSLAAIETTGISNSPVPVALASANFGLPKVSLAIDPTRSVQFMPFPFQSIIKPVSEVILPESFDPENSKTQLDNVLDFLEVVKAIIADTDGCTRLVLYHQRYMETTDKQGQVKRIADRFLDGGKMSVEYDVKHVTGKVRSDGSSSLRNSYTGLIPIDFTPMLLGRLQPPYGEYLPGSALSFRVIYPGYNNRIFAMQLMLVRLDMRQWLTQLLQDERHFISAEVRKAQLLRRFTPSLNNASASALMLVEEEDVIADIEQISFLDPYTQRRILVPAKSTACRHLQCFDLATFLYLNLANLKKACPFCCIEITLTSLQVDMLFMNWLKKNPNSEHVNIDRHGNIHAMISRTQQLGSEAVTRKRNSNEADMDDEETALDNGCNATALEVIDLTLEDDPVYTAEEMAKAMAEFEEAWTVKVKTEVINLSDIEDEDDDAEKNSNVGFMPIDA